jgi:IPT/TIG domain
MSVYANGVALSQADLNALTTSPPAPPVMRKLTADIYQRFSYEATGRFEEGVRLLFASGQIVPQAAIDALFRPATVTAVAPTGGPAAGGTDVVIDGTNLGGVLGVTFGGAAATMVRAVSETKIACRVPAHAAGAVAVVVTDDSGPVTLTGGFTYS